MLFTNGSSASSESAIDEVHNFYQRIVVDALRMRRLHVDAETLADLACIALNRLPPKYIRHAVDFHYFTDAAEIAAMKANVHRAIDFAISKMGGSHWQMRNQI